MPNTYTQFIETARALKEERASILDRQRDISAQREIMRQETDQRLRDIQAMRLELDQQIAENRAMLAEQQRAAQDLLQEVNQRIKANYDEYLSACAANRTTSPSGAPLDDQLEEILFAIPEAQTIFEGAREALQTYISAARQSTPGRDHGYEVTGKTFDELNEAVKSAYKQLKALQKEAAVLQRKIDRRKNG